MVRVSKPIRYFDRISTSAYSNIASFTYYQIAQPPDEFGMAYAYGCSCKHVVPVMTFIGYMLYSNRRGCSIICNGNPCKN